MKIDLKLILTLLVMTKGIPAFAQSLIEDYKSAKKESLRVGSGDKAFMPYIQEGYTLMLPDSKLIKGVLIFLEDSNYDNKNKSAKQMYKHAAEHNFAVLSVSTELPFDFYFTEKSLLSVHHQIHNIFSKHNLPNQNVFFLGASLVGHRAMKYIEFVKKRILDFQLNIKGIVICNFTMDWTRKWHQHERDINIGRINLDEPKFINYMLETYLNGTPLSSAEAYHEFSSYAFSDKENRNIRFYTNLAVRAYIEPAIKYKLTHQLRTLYENNATDIVGFLAELKLAGNLNTELILIQPEDNTSKNRTSQSTWNAVDKEELLDWIQKQTNTK